MKKIEELFHAARGLSAEERTELALRLLDTGEEPDPHAGLSDAEWGEEIERRVDDAASGREPGRPWEEVKADLLKKLGS